MMDYPGLNDETWERIRAYSEKHGISPDEMVNRLLDDAEQNHNLPRLQMEQLTESLPLAIAIFDRDMRYLHVNQGWRDQYRLGDDIQLLGKSHYEIFTEIGDDWKQIHQECLQGAVNNNECAPFPRLDGSLDWVRWDVRPWYSDPELTTIGGIMMITEVITRRVEIEKELRESKERYKRLNELTLEGIIIHQDGIIRDANVAMSQMFGYPQDELLGKPVLDFLFGIDFDEIMVSGKQSNYTKPIEITGIRKDHTPFPLEIRTRQIQDDLQVISLHDISERKKLENALEERELLFKLAFDSSPDSININRLSDGMYIDINQGFRTILGYEHEDVIGKTSLELNIWANAEERNKLVAGLMRDGYVNGLEAEFRHKSGEIVIGLMSARILSYAGEDVILSVTRDITEYKYNQQIRQEYEYLKERFHQEHEHNAFVQRIISTLSHDLRSPLAIIASSRNMLENYYDRISEEERKERLDIIAHQIHFALQILDDTVDLARGNLTEQSFKPSEVNLATLCQVSLQEIQTTQGGNHNMQFINASEIDIAKVDDVLVSRILLNLLSNAIKYSPEGSDITLELNKDNDWVLIQVSDQGMGINDNDLPYIFDPFYRATSAHSVVGTGLGLSIVKNCVDRHNGHINVTTMPGEGSVFTVKLPINANGQNGATS